MPVVSCNQFKQNHRYAHCNGTHLTERFFLRTDLLIINSASGSIRRWRRSLIYVAIPAGSCISPWVLMVQQLQVLRQMKLSDFGKSFNLLKQGWDKGKNCSYLSHQDAQLQQEKQIIVQWLIQTLDLVALPIREVPLISLCLIALSSYMHLHLNSMDTVLDEKIHFPLTLDFDWSTLWDRWSLSSSSPCLSMKNEKALLWQARYQLSFGRTRWYETNVSMLKLAHVN